jgi:hypothetical protein
MSALADAIRRDILKDRPAAPDLDHCLLCSRSFSEDKGAGANGRFCSMLCQAAFDAGYMHRDPKQSYSLPPRGDGFVIECAGCRKQFVSKGLRCCSAECDRQHRERKEIEATIAGMEMESTGYVPRKCADCGGDLPRYVGEGRKRKVSTKRFCSSRCQQAAKKKAGIAFRVPSIINPPQSAFDTSEALVPQAVPSVITVPVDLVGGGSYRFAGPRLDPSLRQAVLELEMPRPAPGGHSGRFECV